MNQELRQRLIGAVVVTALAAIFIPMLFDDPVEEKIQVVSELGIPQEPMVSVDDNDKKLPDDVSNVAALAESQTNSLKSLMPPNRLAMMSYLRMSWKPKRLAKKSKSPL